MANANGFKFIAIFFCLLTLSFACNAHQKNRTKDPIEKAVKFLINVHTGKSMDAVEWLTQETRKAPAFKGFGGLDAMVRQSTDRAEKYGGLRSVTVLRHSRTGNTFTVSIEVKFNLDHREPGDAAEATQERMIWEVNVIKEDGSWKLAI